MEPAAKAETKQKKLSGSRENEALLEVRARFTAAQRRGKRPKKKPIDFLILQ